MVGSAHEWDDRQLLAGLDHLDVRRDHADCLRVRKRGHQVRLRPQGVHRLHPAGPGLVSLP